MRAHASDLGVFSALGDGLGRQEDSRRRLWQGDLNDKTSFDDPRVSARYRRSVTWPSGLSFGGAEPPNPDSQQHVVRHALEIAQIGVSRGIPVADQTPISSPILTVFAFRPECCGGRGVGGLRALRILAWGRVSGDLHYRRSPPFRRSSWRSPSASKFKSQVGLGLFKLCPSSACR